ncbi:hypothetical protein AB0H71_02855 [Nocardia sp. NPDC050697]|uniref:hypothetical protein n=1 Tax=Nocardia sp. NPDC050697 TaxID=3155158 RepID=UPI0034002061
MAHPGVIERLLPLAVARATAPSGLQVTERQLYYELCRLLAPAHRLRRGPGFTVRVPLRYSTFREALGEHPVLTVPPPERGEPGRHTPEPDLFDYGLPRLLLCRSHEIAHMLRANGLPMESACPVLSADELPVHPGVTTMLASVSGTAYVLHEASTAGFEFAARVRELAALPDEVSVVPLGLRPRQAQALHLFHLPGAPTEPLPAPDDRERRWLARGHTVELEAVRPAALLRTVHRLVRGVRTPRTPLLELRRTRDSGFLTWPAA